ncbi:MAG TPA: transporter [Kofleriaceae bacterium]|nr:transporter [Kofleriaceae bacterium]
MSRPLARAAAVLLVALPAASARAGVFDVLEPDTDYTLFHPAPRSELRELVRETSPYSIDAGHAQIDVDLVSATWGSDGSMSDRELDVMGFNARLGLTRRSDVQVEFHPYRETRVSAAGASMQHDRGIGDTTVRLGLNLWGNDGGRTAAGLAPFVRIPTGTGGVGTGALEGGVTIPMELRLPLHLRAALSTEAEFADDVHGRRGVHPRLGVTAGLEHELVGPVSLTAEWRTTVDAEGAVMTYDQEVSSDATITINRDTEVRVGAALAMPQVRAGINPFVQMSYRR